MASWALIIGKTLLIVMILFHLTAVMQHKHCEARQLIGESRKVAEEDSVMERLDTTGMPLGTIPASQPFVPGTVGAPPFPFDQLKSQGDRQVVYIPYNPHDYAPFVYDEDGEVDPQIFHRRYARGYAPSSYEYESVPPTRARRIYIPPQPYTQSAHSP